MRLWHRNQHIVKNNNISVMRTKQWYNIYQFTVGKVVPGGGTVACIIYNDYVLITSSIDDFQFFNEGIGIK